MLCRQLGFWIWFASTASSFIPFAAVRRREPHSPTAPTYRRNQVDAVALNWQTHDILLSECKWGMERVDRKVIRELIEEKTPLVLADLQTKQASSWHVHYALFARLLGQPRITPPASALRRSPTPPLSHNGSR